MRHSALAFASALMLLLCAHPAAAQLEIVDPPPAEAPRSLEIGMGVHTGLRVNYAMLATADGALDVAAAAGPVVGFVLQHEAWRLFDMRIHLLQFGAGWSDEREPELVSQFSVQLGAGVRARAGMLSFAATALVGFAAWLAPGDPFTLDLGAELSLTFHLGCEAFEIGYQALATAGAGGFAGAPSHGAFARWVIASDGPERRACRAQ